MRNARSSWFIFAFGCALLAGLLAPLILHRHPPSHGGGGPPRALASEIAGADLAVALYPSRVRCKFIRADELRILIEAVSSARQETNSVYIKTRPFPADIEFYRGTNLIATIHHSGRVFQAAEGQFWDSSGAIARLSTISDTDQRVPRDSTDWLAGVIMRRPELQNLQSWSLEAMASVKRGNTDPRFIRGAGCFRLREVATPDFLRSAWRVVPQVSVKLAPSGEPQCVLFAWDEGPLLIIGPTSYSPTFSATHLTNVAPGLYAAYH